MDLRVLLKVHEEPISRDAASVKVQGSASAWGRDLPRRDDFTLRGRWTEEQGEWSVFVETRD